MISPNSNTATVELAIPMRAEYVSIARLTAAGVANRVGFDIDAIEDIKVSLSEVCNRIINMQGKYAGGHDAGCKIEFVISGKSLSINFHMNNMEPMSHFIPKGSASEAEAYGQSGVNIDLENIAGDRPAEEQYEDQLQLSLITILMDEFIVNPSENCLVSMKKYVD